MGLLDKLRAAGATVEVSPDLDDYASSGDLGEVAHQLGQVAATLDEVHAAVRAGEPGAVVLPGWTVEDLRRRLARATDPEADREQRVAELFTLAGFLEAALDRAGTS